MRYAVKNGLPIYKTYGMTETCSGVSGFWIHKHPKMLDSVGKRFKNNKIVISNSRVLIEGPTVSPDEYNNDMSSSILTSDLGSIKDKFLLSVCFIKQS